MSFLGNMVGAEGCEGGANPMGQLFNAMGASAFAQPRGMQQGAAMPVTDRDILAGHKWDAEFATFGVQPPMSHSGMPTQLPEHSTVASSSSSSSSSSAAVPVCTRPMVPIFTPTPFMPMAARPPQMLNHQQIRPCALPSGQAMVLGDNEQSYEDKKAASKFFAFTEKVKSDEIRLAGKNMYERQADGSWPEELQKELEEQEQSGAEQRSWLDHDIASDMQNQVFGDVLGDAFDQEDWSAAFQKAMAMHDEGSESMAEAWLNQFRDMTQKTYAMQENNAYDYSEEPFEQGLKLLEAGNLSEAILCFEAAVKRDSSHVAAWQYLGTTQAENEQDSSAVLALQECLRLDPENLVALLAIATSYTNENRHDDSLQSLEKWIQCNPKYKGMAQAPTVDTPDAEDYDIFVTQPKLHARVLNMFRQAAGPTATPDADVYIAMGVMHHMVHSFDDAVTCFQGALQQRPNDARLWNKLGATLANSRRSEDAIVAYNRALDLNPGFVRAQYNLGIAFSNLSQHQEAAKAFLQAIHMQQANVPNCSQSSTHSSAVMWDVLRSTFAVMNRYDLVEKSHSKDPTQFQDEFQFI